MRPPLQFVHEGLGNSSYLVPVSDGHAVAVDPDRNVRRYLQAAEAHGLRIDAVLETHLHADFVTGAVDLAAATGAPVYASSGAALEFPHRPVEAGDVVRAGPHAFEVIPTPGHTPEHVSYLLRPEGGEPALFSGGALIVGGAARTDLVAPELTDSLTRATFRTLKRALAPLPDATLVYPSHGGGSFCSTGDGAARTSTLARERETNPLFAFDSEDEFARWFPATFPGAPDYFFRMRPLNKRGPRLRSEIAPPSPLDPQAFRAAAVDAVIVDLRSPADYARSHVPGALSNTLRPAYATYLGWVVPEDAALLFVGDEHSIDAAVEESLLVGYERFAGYLRGGIEAWTAAGLPSVSSGIVDATAARRLVLDGAAVIDVREPREFEAGHVEGALSIPLGSLQGRLAEIPRDRPIVAYCGHGERSATAVSLLERAGFSGLHNLDGGYPAWRSADLPAAAGR